MKYPSSLFFAIFVSLLSFQLAVSFLISIKPLSNAVRRSKDNSNIDDSSLRDTILQIEKCYGKGSIHIIGDSRALEVNLTSTGSFSLDAILGGGYPKGRVIEIYGPEASGKTTLALHAVAETQKEGGVAAYIDAEHAIDPIYAQSIGVNIKDLLICQPDSGEMALDIVDQLVKSSKVNLIVVDSVAALVPRAELEGDMSESQIGLQARLMSKALRKITASLSKSQAIVIFINQLRSKVGVMFGSPEVTSGGNALKFYSSVRLDIRKRDTLLNNEGVTARVKVVKNKVFPPFQFVDMDIIFGQGFDRIGTLIDACEMTKIIERKGAWYNYGENKLGQGKKTVRQTLIADKELREKLEEEFHSRVSSRSYSLKSEVDDKDSN